MKKHIGFWRRCSQIIFFFLILPFSLSAAIYDGPTDDATFLELLQQVKDKRALLDQKVEEAKAAGVSVDYAQVSQTTIRLFSEVFAPWDRANPEVVKQMYDAVYFGRFDPVGPEGLPFDELVDCLDVADAAIAQLQQQIDGEINLQSPPDFAQSTLKLNGTHYQLNGNKVFASKFFWQPNEEDVMQAYGRSGEGYLSVQHLETETKIKNWSKSSLRNNIQTQANQNRSPIQFFLGHIVPPSFWLRQDYPEAFEGSRIFTDYDIDNPNTKLWLSHLFSEQLTSAIEPLGDTERVHMIANEPMFSIREGGVESSRGVSDYTMDKYQDWLTEKYATISNLNAVYGTSFTSFAEVKSTYTIPLPLSYQGGPVWYDWNKFNLDRGNEWFQFLHDGIHAVDPYAKTHVKVMGERSIHTPYQDEGLDFEFITNLVDMPGSDAQMSSFAADWDLRHEQGWRERYSLEWRAQSIMLDFMKSIAPNKHMYDSEWHNLSGSRWRDFHMSPEYVRATFYLGITHGLGSVTTWVWNRKADGAIDPRADFIGTSVTQPIQLDAYGRAWKEINAHGNVALSLTPTQRHFMVYYNKDAAIQDSEYTFHMSQMYEALKLMNVAVGFVTPSTLGTLDKSSQVLFVSPTQYIADAELTALQSFAQAGGKIVMLNHEQYDNFAKTEVGVSRLSGTEVSTFYATKLDEVLPMMKDFEANLSSIKPHQDITVSATDASQNSVYGVLLNQTKQADGTINISLINTSQETAYVSLHSTLGYPSDLLDLITSNNLPLPIVMPPMDVKLINLTLADTAPIIYAQAVSIDAAQTTLTVAETVQASATILPLGSSFNTLVWTSNNSDVATVDDSGLITAVGAGTANIQVMLPSNTQGQEARSAQIQVTVLAQSKNAGNNDSEPNKSSGGAFSLLILLALFGIGVAPRFVWLGAQQNRIGNKND